MAVDAFRDFWTDSDIDLVTPEDMPAEDVASLANRLWQRSIFWTPTF